MRLSIHDLGLLSLRTRLVIGVPALLLLLAAFWIAAQFLHPLPPRRVVMATGPAGGALHRMGEAYAALLAREGIAIELRATAGTGENIRLVEGVPPQVDVAFVLAGTASAPDHLVNVSNLFVAPLFALLRGSDPPTTLAGLRGKRVALGPAGSGLAQVLQPLFAANGVTAQNTTLLHLSDSEALRRIGEGELDVMFSGEGLRSVAFVDALARPGISLMHFERANAYVRQHPNIVRLELPPGSVDLARDIPGRSTALIGSTVMLAAREDLHPTVVDLLVDAARIVNGKPGYFEARGEFPNLARTDAIPVSTQAVAHASHGPSLLRRYLPLWLADFLQRMLTLAVPVVAVAFPLLKLLPWLADHVFQDKIDRRYAELRRLEIESARGTRPLQAIHADLLALAAALRRLHLPVAYVDQLYALRRNVAEVLRETGAR